MSLKYYDTNALLNLQEKAFEENFILDATVLRELENIKTSKNKDEETRYKARKITKLLDKHFNSYEVYDYDFDCVNNDDHICKTANWLAKVEGIDIDFITDDVSCRNIAKKVYKLDKVSKSSSYDELKDKYTGFKNVEMDDVQLAYFYEHLDENIYDLLLNQYIVIFNKDGMCIDKLFWNGERHEVVKFQNLKSDYFGMVKPYCGDPYQSCAFHSIQNNQLTVLKGHAGTGKSYIALSYLLHQLEKRKIDKIICFCNTVATVNSAKLGYYPGSRTEKLLDSQVGNMLSSKLGDVVAVERMIEDGDLLLLPMSDIRGYDTTGMKAGIYITEAQNMDISLMKLALQRIGEDSICIIDGDDDTQVDMNVYSGANNGMRRMSEVFRGNDFYGEVELQNIYRSKIAAIADEM